MVEIDQSEERPQLFLDAVLQPHRSLPPRGFAAVMAVLAGASLIAGVTCVLVGAWPVFGFFGLDVALVYLAFRASYRSARRSERVRLTDRSLIVEHISVRGERRQWRFEPYWIRIVFEEKDETNSLALASHGRQLPVGNFLAPEVRRRFAATLGAALERWRAFVAGN